MLPTIITICVMVVCLATAAYILVRFAAWITRLLRPKPKSDDRGERPPDLFQGF